jgi:CheY-like chemotaxis protein
VRGVLRAEGYRVLEAADGLEALKVAGTAGGGIDLLLTDVVMPRMGGHELADRLRGSLPGLRIVFMSGYVGDQAGKDALSGEAAAFLQKPFSPKALAGMVRNALGPVPDQRLAGA